MQLGHENFEASSGFLSRFTLRNGLVSKKCLEAIAGIRRFFQASNLPENVFDALTVLEDYALQQQITRKTKQTKITELFDNMIKKENN